MRTMPFLPVMTTPATWLLLSLCATFLACGGTTGGGGGGGAASGGAPGTPCNAVVANQGCNGLQIVQCLDGKWAAQQLCITPQICKELADPAAPGTLKKVATCQDLPTSSTADTSSDTTVADVGGADGAGVDVPGLTDTTTLPDVAVGEDVPDFPDVPTFPDVPVTVDVPVIVDVPDVQTGAKCGNGVCEGAETTANCPKDCPDLTCTYTVPTTNPGCTSTADKTFIAILTGSVTLKNDFAQVVSDCTLKQGCLAKGNNCVQADGPDTARGLCIADCIVQAQATLQKISKNCAWCYGEYSGVCGFNACLSDCAVDPNSTTCTTCLATNCDAKLYACQAGDALPTTVYCGNGTCDTGETTDSCAADCGAPVNCADGVCGPGETAANCASDCKGAAWTCGNGKCEKGETQSLCAKDCAVSTAAGCVAGSGPGCTSGGCTCQNCVCNGPIPNGYSSAGDSYCCSSGWDAQCAAECHACGGCTP